MFASNPKIIPTVNNDTCLQAKYFAFCAEVHMLVQDGNEEINPIGYITLATAEVDTKVKPVKTVR